MLGTDAVMQWLKTLGAFDADTKWTMARMDAAKEKRIGVYAFEDTAGASEVAIGGRAATLTRLARYRVLVHWTKNSRDTEQAALALCDALAFNPPVSIDGLASAHVRLDRCENVGPDDNGIFEQVVLLDIYYQEDTDG